MGKKVGRRRRAAAKEHEKIHGTFFPPQPEQPWGQLGTQNLGNTWQAISAAGRG